MTSKRTELVGLITEDESEESEEEEWNVASYADNDEGYTNASVQADLSETRLIKKQYGGASSSTSWLIYISHFMSAWGDRMWWFAVGLFLVIINPESLQLTAVYGLVLGFATLLLGPLVGGWVDATPRLRAAQFTLVLQNMSTVVCAAVVFCYLVYKDELLATAWWLEYAAYALIITLSTMAHIASMANTIAVERDWVVEICGSDEERLASMTSTMKAIDLTTQILAPIATGQVMTYGGSKVGALFIGAWNFVSCAVEYYLLWKVYRSVPALMARADWKKSDDNPKKEKQGGCCKMLSGLTVFYTGFRSYMRYDVWMSGLALSLLYMTVLGFDNITIGFAQISGLSESVIGVFQGVGGFMGIMGTILYPRLRRRIGLARAGLVSLILQAVCLAPCVVSVWLPGSPFDFFGTATTPVENCTNVLEASVTSITSLKSTTLPPPNETAVGMVNVTGAGGRAVGEMGVTPTVCEATPTSLISVLVLISGIVLARTGLWSADLSITQMFLESVAEHERGVVNGVQNSLNQLQDMIKFAIVTALPLSHQFGYLVFLSYLAIATAVTLQAVFVCCFAPESFKEVSLSTKIDRLYIRYIQGSIRYNIITCEIHARFSRRLHKNYDLEADEIT